MPFPPKKSKVPAPIPGDMEEDPSVGLPRKATPAKKKGKTKASRKPLTYFGQPLRGGMNTQL